MPDEKNYVSYVVDRGAALRCLGETERVVLEKAFQLWQADAELEAYMIRDQENRRKRAERKEQERIKQANEALGESSTANAGPTESSQRSSTGGSQATHTQGLA